MTTLHLGAHMSIAGGLHKAFERIEAVGGTALQLFTRNQRQWKVPPLADEDVAAFRAAWERWGDYPVAAHDSYLINLANPDPAKAERAVGAFAEELRRCERLGIPWLVTHPGSHLGSGTEPGIARYAANLDAALEQSGTETVMPLLETTAGQGTNLGGTFAELGSILAQSRHAHRLGVCLDTCHAFAAGYDLRSGEALDATLAEFDALVGLKRLRFVHLNDSKTPLGAHRDRHEHIGQGEIGTEGFRAVMRHPLLSTLPLCLETPKDDDLEDDRRNLALLQSFTS